MKGRSFVQVIASAGLLAALVSAVMLGREVVSLGSARASLAQLISETMTGPGAPWFWLGAIGAAAWAIAWSAIERQGGPAEVHLTIGQGAASAALVIQAIRLAAGLLAGAPAVTSVKEVVGFVVALVFWAFLRWTAVKGGDSAAEYNVVSRKISLFTWSTIAALVTLAGLYSAVSGLFFRLTGITPLTSMIPVGWGYAVAGATAWIVAEILLRRDSARSTEAPVAATIRRTARLSVAAAALAAFLCGLSELLRIIVSTFAGISLGEGAAVDTGRARFVQAAALALVGAPTWWGFWWSQQSRTHVPETAAAEQTALPRRLYLYGIVVISAAAFFFSLGTIVFGALSARGVASGVPWAAAGLVALVCLVGHLAVLRGDERAAGQARQPAPAAGASSPPPLPQRPIIVVIDGGDGSLGARLMAGLAAGLPAMSLWSIGLNATAQLAMPNALAAPGDVLERAALIVGPTDIIAPGGLGGEVTAAFAAAVCASGARKLLLPPRDPALRWVAAPAWPDERWIENAVNEAGNLLRD